MTYRIFDQMDQCTDAEVERLCALASPQRKEQALRYRHTFGRFACLKTYLMLCELLGKPTLLFRYSAQGKPFLQHYPDLHFSISHCRNGLAVAVDNRPVGIDIESFRPFSESLLSHCMHPAEAESVRNAPCPELAFAGFWTRKEAVLKLRGTGLVSDLHHVLEGTETTSTCFRSDKKYAYSIASAF
jgi:4'-phosphopantetheinyl transferase